MNRRYVALLFVLYFVVAITIGFIEGAPRYGVSLVNPETVGSAIGTGLFLYVLSGIVPWAVWGARGFCAAKWASLFVPWAALLVAVMILQQIGRSHAETYPYRAGSDRREFIIGMVKECVKTQQMAKAEITLAYTYCVCSAEEMADNITQDENDLIRGMLKRGQTREQMASAMEKRLIGSAATCNRKLGF
jgi:hypothetical protein